MNGWANWKNYNAFGMEFIGHPVVWLIDMGNAFG